ncbi:4Fe-4S dicluster domain-containing protein [Natronospora cellulosivora (SeqCode)]
MSAEKILEKVRDAGVIGAGGAGFPTHVKLNAEVDTVIVNGAECEPLLRVDQELMAKERDRFLSGLEFVRESTGAKEVIIALKSKYKEVIKKLEELIPKHKNFSIYQLDDFYPAGDEQQIVYDVTGRIVPEGGIPLMAGVVVINVETIINVDNAIKGISVSDKYLTIGGAVKKPITVLLPIGTKIRDILHLAGGPTVDEYKLIDGGPMMGRIVSPDDFVAKTTKGILVLPSNHNIILNKTTPIASSVKRAMSACCQCRACTDVCPRFLLGHSIEPHKIMRAINYGIDTDSNSITKAMLCCECGVCDTWGCPMGLSPRNINIELKKELAKGNYKNTHKESPVETHPMREYRKVPVKRLIKRLGIADYDLAAPISEVDFKPEIIELALSQHIGAPAKAMVNVGDRVNKGQLIAKIPDNSLGANIHAGITGTVKSVGDSIIIER